MANPEVIDGNATLTDMQFQLLRIAVAQCDFANLHGDSECMEAAWHNAKLALASLGERTAEEKSGMQRRRWIVTDTQLQRMAEAAAVIRRVVGTEFHWEPPGLRPYGKHAVMTLLHQPGDPLRPYCNYDCNQYDKIESLSDALSEVGLFVEDCTGDYSGVYEAQPLRENVDADAED